MNARPESAAGRGRCAVAGRIPLGTAAGAGGCLGLAVVGRSFPGRRGLVTGLRHRGCRRSDGNPRVATAHPSGRPGRVQRRGRFLPARQRPLRVRIPVVSRRAPLAVGAAPGPGRAARTRRRGRAHHRPAARHRPAQERGSGAQRQRVAAGHGAVGRARRVLAVARAEQCAHRESPVAGDDRLFARAVGRGAESLVQQPAPRGPRTRRPPAARARAGHARFRGIRIPLPDRIRRIPLDAGPRPRRRMGPVGPAGAGHRRHARHRRRETRRGAPGLERAHARDRGLGRGHRAVGNQLPHRHHALVQRLVRPPRHRSLRWRRARHALGREPASGRGPGGHAALLRTRQRQGRVLRRRVPHQDARAAPGAGCSNAAAWSSATPTARPCACSACAWTSTRPRSPSARPTRATSASRRRCS